MFYQLYRSFANYTEVHAFFISNTFISNARFKFAKNQTKAKQHLEVEFLLFENYSLSSSTLSPRNNKKYSKKIYEKQVRLFKWGYMINDNESEAGYEK